MGFEYLQGIFIAVNMREFAILFFWQGGLLILRGSADIHRLVRKNRVMLGGDNRLIEWD